MNANAEIYQESVDGILDLALTNHIDPDLLEAYAENMHITDAEEALDRFQDDYQGTFDSLEAWAEDFLEQTGELEAMPKHLCHYFDYEAYARDCEHSGDIFTLDADEGTAVFWNR